MISFKTIMKKLKGTKLCDALGGYLFLLPNFIGFFVFTSLAVFASFLLSFPDWDILSTPGWVCIQSFTNLAKEHFFRKYIGNTLLLMMGIPAAILLSLGLALILNRKAKKTVFFRTLYFFPTICTAVAIHTLWRWIYNPGMGLLNTTWANPPLVLMGMWTAIGGYSMILCLAELQTIDPELYGAAEIDGAGRLQKFRRVTCPMLAPTALLISIIGIIAAFHGGFQAVYIMTGKCLPVTSTTSSYYNNAHEWFKMGYANFITWFLFILILIVTPFNWKYARRAAERGY